MNSADLTSNSLQVNPAPDARSARHQMVDQQVRTWDVFDQDVLDAMATVEREHFVPDALRHCAYADAEIPLAHGQCMLRPSVAGRILQAVNVKAGDRVLEIGTGTGYLTSCIARIAGSVTSIDLYEDFIHAAKAALERDGIANATVLQMDATTDLPDGSFDVVIITGSLPEEDPRFIDKLGPGGRLFVVVGAPPAMRALRVTRADNSETTTEQLFETNIPALVAPARAPVFAF
jgi:protein-L-isoaspartate(D-aspartate) O-methyltransferase